MFPMPSPANHPAPATWRDEPTHFVIFTGLPMNPSWAAQRSDIQVSAQPRPPATTATVRTGHSNRRRHTPRSRSCWTTRHWLGSRRRRTSRKTRITRGQAPAAGDASGDPGRPPRDTRQQPGWSV